MAELKPCPFCGGKMSVTYHSAAKEFRVWHSSGENSLACPILEPFIIDTDAESLADAAEAWNRRAK